MKKTFERILLEVAGLPSAAHVMIFGSVARLAESPRDVDLALVDRECVGGKAIYERHRESVDALLALSYNFYGCLDPFLMTQGGLWVRNDEATNWQRAKCKEALRESILAEGVLLADLLPKINFEHYERPGVRESLRL